MAKLSVSRAAIKRGENGSLGESYHGDPTRISGSRETRGSWPAGPSIITFVDGLSGFGDGGWPPRGKYEKTAAQNTECQMARRLLRTLSRVITDERLAPRWSGNVGLMLVLPGVCF